MFTMTLYCLFTMFANMEMALKHMSALTYNAQSATIIINLDFTWLIIHTSMQLTTTVVWSTQLIDG